MAVVKRIGPGSAFKVGLAMYALLGLILGAMFSLISLVARPGSPHFLGAFFGVGAIIILPVFYGLIGGIFAALGAVIYNLISTWVGGLEVDIS